MQLNNLGVIERKVLGALLIMADESVNNTVHTTIQNIADCIGYKSTGGAITFALKILERDNYLIKSGKQKYELLI